MLEAQVRNGVQGGNLQYKLAIVRAVMRELK